MQNHKTLFIIDDDEDDQLFLQEAMNDLNIPIDCYYANNGETALQQLRNEEIPVPDFIFLDLNMPCKNGFECLQEIKGSPALRFIPVIIFSTSAQPDTIDKVYAQGANYYICKPGTFLLLKKAIEYVLSINWQEDSIQPPREKFVIQP